MCLPTEKLRREVRIDLCDHQMHTPPRSVFDGTPSTEIYTLSLHDALPIYSMPSARPAPAKPPHTTSGALGRRWMPCVRDSRAVAGPEDNQLEGPVSKRAISRPSSLSRRNAVLDPPPSIPR